MSQFNSFLNLLKDGLTLINSFRVNNKYSDGINIGIFLNKYIVAINPILTNVLSLVNIESKDVIYNLISAIYNELSLCYFNNQNNQNKDLESMFLYSVLALRYSSESEKVLDEYRKYQGYGVKTIGKNYIKYNREIVEEMINYTKDEMSRVEVKDENEMKNKIIVTMTTCKRFDLFEQTINSFLSCCNDRHLISEFLVIDDNSSDEDKKKMMELYPFVKFCFKDQNNKGHAKSMNIIRSYVLNKKYPYMFHMEDDWRFLFKDNLITKCKTVLESNSKYGQCLLNKNYSEEDELYKYVGGIRNELNLDDKITGNSIKYYEHEYYQGTEMYKKMNENVGRNTCYYWPSYSLRVSLIRTEIFKEIGNYNESAEHFEMEYAHRYTLKNYKSVYLETLYCQHLGRKTWEINNTSIKNAYSLNDQTQFGKVENKVEKKVEVIERMENKVEVIKRMENKEIEKKSLEDELISFIKDVINNKQPTLNFNNKMIELINSIVKEEKKEEIKKITLDFTQNKEEIREETKEEKLIDLEASINMENTKVKDKMYKMKTYVINLEKRKDRLDSFKSKNWDKIKSLNPVFFKAVDGNLVKPTNKILKLFEAGDFNYRKGIIGCACSHILLWLELIRNKDLDTLLILEDDIILPDDFTGKLTEVLQKAPFVGNRPIWSVLFLNHFPYIEYKHKQRKNGDIELELWDKQRIIRESAGSTMGYLITKTGAENIIQHIQDNSVYNAIDWCIFKTSLNNKYLKSLEEAQGKSLIYYCNPPIVYPVNENIMATEKIDSDIQYNKDSLKMDIRQRLKREIIYWNLNLKSNGYKSFGEQKIEGLNYNENSNIIISESIPTRLVLLSNIIIVPFNSYIRKVELIKQFKEYPIVYYTLEDLSITRITDPEVDIPQCPVNGYFISVPESKINDKVKTDIAFECYINDTFSVECN